MICPICQNEMGTGDTGSICTSCKNKMDSVKESYNNMQPYYQYGWVCPKCGSVYSPSTSSCYKCGPQIKFEITSNTH